MVVQGISAPAALAPLLYNTLPPRPQHFHRGTKKNANELLLCSAAAENSCTGSSLYVAYTSSTSTALSRATVAHLGTARCKTPLPERPPVLRAFVCDETDNNECNDRDTSKHPETDGQHLELLAGQPSRRRRRSLVVGTRRCRVGVVEIAGRNGR